MAGKNRIFPSLLAALLSLGVGGHVVAQAITTWTPLATGVDLNVFALEPDGNGGVYAGGQFTTAGGSPANGIAYWNGSTWSALGTGVDKFGGGAYVSAIELNGSDIYAGGVFESAGSVITDDIARWNGSTWNALGAGIDGAGVFALARSGSNLYVGGNFTAAGPVITNNIAQWNGSTWSALGTSGTDAPVQALAVAPNGDLYIGGEFTDVDGVPASSIARWNGSSWSAVGGGVDYANPSTNPNIFALAFDAAGNLYVGGTFDQAGTGLLPVRNIAKWDGAAWSAVGTGTDGSVNDLVFDSSGRLYAAYYGNTSSTGDIDRWDGSTWTTLPSGADSSINTLAFSNMTTLIAGGDFTEIGGQLASRVASTTIPAVALPDGPTAPIQQFGVPAGTTSAQCAALAPPSVDWPALVSLRSIGWSISFAQWPNDGAGGWVCTRQPIYTSSGWGFS